MTGPETADGQRLTAEAVALRSAEVMWAADEASRALGMRLVEVGPGRAVLAMSVRADMLNGFAVCHGGVVAALADSAFAFACNASGTVTVATGFDVTFLESARLGDELVAAAEERVVRGRSGVYDVTVLRSANGTEHASTVIALFRGRSRSLGRPVDPAAG